jgi:diguanylate cyclase (GGDEF)-like protein
MPHAASTPRPTRRPPSPDADRRTAPAFGLLCMYAAATLLTAMEAFTTHDGSVARTPLLLVVGAGSVLTAGLWLFGHRAGPAALGALVAIGTALTAVEIHYTDGVPNAATLFYFWAMLYAFYVFPRRHALLQAALVGVEYALVIYLNPPTFSSVTHWATTMAAIVGAGLFVGNLTDRLDDRMERLADDARTDALTGLLNRRGFDQAVVDELARARRGGRPLSILITDLDHFKQVNDVHGHAAGDETLRRVAAVIDARRRHCDTVARYGGEEFTLILPDASAAGALAAADLLRETLERHFAGSAVGVTASFGVATFPADGTTADELMRHADEALYVAKARGRNRVVSFGDLPGRAPVVPLSA